MVGHSPSHRLAAATAPSKRGPRLRRFAALGDQRPPQYAIRYIAKQSFSLMCYSLLGILNPRMAPLAAVSVISPPMTWFLLMSRVAYTGSVAPG